jgi:recombination protein RecA
VPLPRASAELIKAIRKQYGDHAISVASEIPKFDVVSSGSLCLDYITDIGGLPSNRVVEFAGDPGSGKSTLALHAVNNFLKAFPDRLAVYFDAEQKLTIDWATNFIEDMDRLLVINPDHVEQATDMYKKFAVTGEVSVCVLDSIGGIPTKRTTEKSAEIGSFGGNSMGVGEFARNAATMGGKYGICTIGVNQVREDMEGFRRLKTPGGNAWKHACSLRIQFRRGPDKYVEKRPNGEEIQVGYDVVVKTIKSGVGTPFKATKYRFYSERSDSGAFGVDRLEEIVRLAKLAGVIQRRGAWYYHDWLPGGQVQGEKDLVSIARTVPAFAAEIERQIREKITKGDAIAGAAITFDEEYADTEDNGYLARRLNQAETEATGDDL